MDRSLLLATAPIYLPVGWESVDTTLAWIAFGSAMPRGQWDYYLYQGASGFQSRTDILISLVEAASGFFPEDHVRPHLRNDLQNLAFVLTARRAQRAGAVPDRSSNGDVPIREAAEVMQRLLRRRWRRDPRWEDQDSRAEIEAIEAAGRTLCQEIGLGHVPAFGWPGARPEQKREVTAPRTRIPLCLCEGPVSFDPDGTLIPCLPSDYPLSAVPLFSDIVIPAEAILTTWPAPEDDMAPGEAAPKVIRQPASRRGNGGRPRRGDWPTFSRQLIRVLTLDGGDITRTDLKRQMKDWAGQHMDPMPSERSIEREVDQLVEPGIIPD
jgi:hypothetical protein